MRRIGQRQKLAPAPHVGGTRFDLEPVDGSPGRLEVVANQNGFPGGGEPVNGTGIEVLPGDRALEMGDETQGVSGTGAATIWRV